MFRYSGPQSVPLSDFWNLQPKRGGDSPGFASVCAECGVVVLGVALDSPEFPSNHILGKHML